MDSAQAKGVEQASTLVERDLEDNGLINRVRETQMLTIRRAQKASRKEGKIIAFSDVYF